MGGAELCHSAVREVGKVPKKAERCVLGQESRITSNAEESWESVRSPVRQLSKTSAIKGLQSFRASLWVSPPFVL